MLEVTQVQIFFLGRGGGGLSVSPNIPQKVFACGGPKCLGGGNGGEQFCPPPKKKSPRGGGIDHQQIRGMKKHRIVLTKNIMYVVTLGTWSEFRVGQVNATFCSFSLFCHVSPLQPKSFQHDLHTLRQVYLKRNENRYFTRA